MDLNILHHPESPWFACCVLFVSMNTDLCGCGCALLIEPCPCWRSCSSCTCTSHRRSSPGRPPGHLDLDPPQTGGPDHSAHSWGQLRKRRKNVQTSVIKWLWRNRRHNTSLKMYRPPFPPAWNGSPGSLSPQTKPEIMLTCWVCWVRYSWNSFTKSTGSVLISSMLRVECNTIQRRWVDSRTLSLRTLATCSELANGCLWNVCIG